MGIDRVESGVEGLDKLLEGGFPKDFSVVVVGSPGTGKTIFGLQYLYHGAMNGEPGIYVAFEKNRTVTINQALRFGWDIERLEEEKKLSLQFLGWCENIEEVIQVIKDEAKRIDAKRMVIDSMTIFAEAGRVSTEGTSREVGKIMESTTESKFKRITRQDIFFILGHIEELDLTSILISEALEDHNYIPRDRVLQYLCDGLISLHYVLVGPDAGRSLMIHKMRATKHSENVHPVEIIENGMKVLMVEGV